MPHANEDVPEKGKEVKIRKDSSAVDEAKKIADDFRHGLHDLQRTIVDLQQRVRKMPELAGTLELETKVDVRPPMLPEIAEEVRLEEHDVEVLERSRLVKPIETGDWTRSAFYKEGDEYLPIETYGKVRLQFRDDKGTPLSGTAFRLVATQAETNQLVILGARHADQNGYAAIRLSDVEPSKFKDLRVEVERESGGDDDQHDRVIRLDIGAAQIDTHGPMGLAHRFLLNDPVKRRPGDVITNAVDDPDADDLDISPDSFGLTEEHVDGNCCLRPNTDLPSRQYFFRQIVRATRRASVHALSTRDALQSRAGIQGPVPYLDESASTYVVKGAQPMLGYVNSYRMGWYPKGRSLGELLYSLALAPCEQVNLAFIDWMRSERDTRRESNVQSERLAHELGHDRSIEESVDSVLTEHQSGSTRALGGGLSVDLGFISFGGGGGGTTSSTEGRRELQADTVQEVSDRIVQRSSSMRSRRSTVVTTSHQRESERIQTRTVRNHNRNHAMTIQYFQVISNYEVRTELVEEKPVILVPYEIDNAIFDQLPRFEKFRVSPSRPITRFLDRHKSVLQRYVPRKYRDNFVALRRLLHCQDIYGIEKEFATASRWRIDLDQNLRPGVTLAIETDDGQLIALNALGSPKSGFAEFSSDPVRMDRVESLRVSFDPEAAVKGTLGDLPSFLGDAVSSVIEQSVSFKIKNAVITARTDVNRFLPERRNLRIQLASDPSVTLSASNPSASISLSPPNIDFSSALTQEKKDYCELKELVAHIQERPLLYLRLIWLREDPERRAMRFDRINFNGIPLIDRIINRPVGVTGNYVAFPLLEGRRLVEVDTPTHFISKRLVSLPTRGVFAEAFLSCCNATEKLDVDRLRTPETECADSAPQIGPIVPASRQSRGNTIPTDFASPIVNIQNPPSVPDPSGLAGAFNVLGMPNIFRDLSRGAELLQFINNATKEAFTSTRQHRAAMDQLAGDLVRGIVSGATGIPIPSSGGNKGAASSGTKPITTSKEAGAGAVKNTSPKSKSSAANDALTSANSASVRQTSPSQIAAQLQNVKRAFEAGQINEQQMKERSNSILGGIQSTNPLEIGDGPVIILDAPASTEGRAFNPHSADVTGVISMQATVQNLPEGGRARWAREDTSTIEISHRDGATTEVTGVKPGLTAIDYIVEDSTGDAAASIKIPLSVPQFVAIGENSAEFDAVLTAFQIDDIKNVVLQEARAVARNLLSTVNVRTVWTMAPFNESLPAQFGAGQAAAGQATTVTLRGNPGTTCELGVTPVAPAVGPAHPNEQITIHPGALDDVGCAWDVDESIRAVVNVMKTQDFTDVPTKDLARRIFGRCIGFAIAHEILHALLGFQIPTGHNSPAIPGDIMNNGVDLSFLDFTGIEINDMPNFPDPASFVDHGIPSIARLGATNQAIANRFFPVPPAF